MQRGPRTTTKEKLLQIFEASPDLTLQEYGNRLGVTKERVRQLIACLGLERQRRKHAGQPICPECGGRKSYEAKLCRACWWQSR
ncbi:MAG: hypothetical protein DDT27_00515 [Dehalococcoidia bacterium]|nr:hypothetical protein [Chloroflexota bacterium]MBT9159637.1 hypothetical protein [Chloroflexota bacterium]MBT9161972.1 hypothetical protein [Chloroflexota bacterium]